MKPSYLFLAPNPTMLHLAEDLVNRSGIRAFIVVEQEGHAIASIGDLHTLGSHYEFFFGRHEPPVWITRERSSSVIRKNGVHLLNMMDRLETVNHKVALHERLHLLQLMTSYWDYILATKNLSGVVFSNIPHEIYDFVIYLLAKANRIPTLIFHQTQISGLASVNTDIDQIGVIENGARLLSGTGTPPVDPQRILDDLQVRSRGGPVVCQK